ncbi:uncharacterized protein DFL_003238 [Arthrobotrys flagrans]|uniref:Uncharacterized protein n=1 Tax=Arthrobotrys flagrans TaxID=97331 RepID=A0A437A0W3_ARTFL|nr:hypothetical protein DFL_003238 [Arthrobotrys flagrans]
MSHIKLSRLTIVTSFCLGSLPLIGEAGSFIKKSSGTREQLYTIESAVLLSLLLVDARLQAIWSLLEENGGRFSKLQSSIGKFEHPETLTFEQLKILKNARGIDALTCDFIALWFELGNRVDLIGDSDCLLQTFSQVLDEWENDDNPCIAELDPPKKLPKKVQAGLKAKPPAVDLEVGKVVEQPANAELEPEQLSESITPEVNKEAGKPNAVEETVSSEADAGGEPSVPPKIERVFTVVDSSGETGETDDVNQYRVIKELKSRKALVEWARGNDRNGTKRSDLISKMLVLLQPRTFLMDLSFRCHSDSTDAYLAEAETNITLRMI